MGNIIIWQTFLTKITIPKAEKSLLKNLSISDNKMAKFFNLT